MYGKRRSSLYFPHYLIKDKMEQKNEREMEIELVKKYLVAEGYNNISTNVTILGKSGIQHPFDILAKSYDQRDSIAVDVIAEEKELGIEEMLKIFAKLYDTSLRNSTVVILSELTPEAKRFAEYSNIKIFKKKELEEKIKIREHFIPSGVPGLDKILGGFLKGRVYLLVGKAGTGKTTFGIQFLLQGSKNGEVGLLITTDQKPENLIYDFEISDIKLRDYIAESLLHILDLTRQVEELKMKLGSGDISPVEYSSRIINDLFRHATRIKAERIVIDSFTTLMLSHHVWSRDIARKMILSIEDIGATTLLIKDAPPSREELEEVFVQGVILLDHDDTGRYIQVTKAKGSSFDTLKHHINYKKGIGICIKE